MDGLGLPAMPIVGLSTSWSLYSVEAQGLWTSGPRQPAVVLRGVLGDANTSHNLRRHVALIPFGARSVGKASAVPAVPVSCAESQGHGTLKGPRLARFRPNGRVDHSDRRWCASLVRAKNVRLGGTARSAGAPTRPGSPCFCWISGGWSERCHSAPGHLPTDRQSLFSDRIGSATWQAGEPLTPAGARGREDAHRRIPVRAQATEWIESIVFSCGLCAAVGSKTEEDRIESALSVATSSRNRLRLWTFKCFKPLAADRKRPMACHVHRLRGRRLVDPWPRCLA